MTLKETYTKEIVPKLKESLKCENIMEVPKLEKVVLNMGIGTYIRTGNKDYSVLQEHLALIAGQAPIVKHAKKAISNFKLRAGMPVGLTVTLRGDAMYTFLDKLINVVLPRVRDFRGVSPKSFDKEGNYNFGIREHTIFPEVPQDDVVKNHGIQITVKTTAKSKEAGKELLSQMGFPFAK
ncbi:50S ribosomal protein L5 [Candidatus Gracilibacteria bacterium]|nr:50S ribosomal protein L5 [Candidatus Gracilibacteria bacterium]